MQTRNAAMNTPQAAASGIAGVTVTHLGYQWVLAAAAAIAAAAAFLFWRLFSART
jgi:predicted MFS family arabinose efflux permease